jgi:tagaturonate reductase
MKVTKNAKGEFVGTSNDIEYKVTDDNAAYFAEAWKEENLKSFVSNVLSNETLWGGPNLTILPDFEDAVYKKLTHILHDGVFDNVKK